VLTERASDHTQLIFAVETETGAARPIMVGEEPAPADPSAAIDKSPRSEGGGRGNRNSQMYEASGAGELEQKLEKLRGAPSISLLLTS